MRIKISHIIRQGIHLQTGFLGIGIMSIGFKVKNVISKVVDSAYSLDNRIQNEKKRYVLAYHRVLPREVAQQKYIQPAMWISPETFSLQIEWMKSVGDIVSLDEIMNTHDNDRPMFCLTFDDGWYDNYDYAFPILKKHDVPATIFVVTDAINSGQLFWVETLIEKSQDIFEGQLNEARDFVEKQLQDLSIAQGLSEIASPLEYMDQYIDCLKTLQRGDRKAKLEEFYNFFNIKSAPVSRQLLSWDQIEEMSQHKVSFESHTHRHEILKQAPEELMREEIKLSKDCIEEKLGGEVKHFCYPNGDFDEKKLHILREEGYSYAYVLGNGAISEQVNDFLQPRFLVYEDVCSNMSYFKCRLLEVPKFA